MHRDLIFFIYLEGFTAKVPYFFSPLDKDRLIDW